MEDQPKTSDTNLKVVYRPKGVKVDLPVGAGGLDFEEAKRRKHEHQIGLGMAGVKEVVVEIRPDDTKRTTR